MKIDFIGLIGVAIFSFSCGGSDIKFSEAQPGESKSLMEFPSDFQSYFTFQSDSTIIGYFDMEYSSEPDDGVSFEAKNSIEISDKAIFNHLEGSVTLDFKLIEDSTSKALFPNKSILDTLINEYFKRPNYKYNLKSNKDSVLVFDVYLVDTMFYVSKSNVIKKYRKGVYLNIADEVAAWSVYQVMNEGNMLFFNSISVDDEAILRRIMKTNGEDSEKEMVSPSKNSFKTFLKMGGFENRIEQQKVSIVAN